MTRTTRQVAMDHLEAVENGDPSAMADDYAENAILHRAGEVYAGRAAIEAYFGTVPARLGGGRVVFDDFKIDGSLATFHWRLEGAPSAASGHDVCTIADGKIVSQVVHLNDSDF